MYNLPYVYNDVASTHKMKILYIKVQSRYNIVPKAALS